MSEINKDLQATHKILTIVEQSKSHNDELLDKLPGIFSIIDDESRVLRGNLLLASTFKCELEEVIEKKFSSIFRDEAWKIFSSKIQSIQEGKNSDEQFELEITVDGEEDKSFYWYISKFSPGKKSDKKFYSIVGEDISELRKKEKQLMEIFSSIPLGIMTVGSNKQVEPQYSQFTEYLLDNKEIEGKNFEEVLFGYTIANGTPEEKEGVKNIQASIGENELIFESLKSTFPTQIWYPIEDNLDGGRWLGISYQPVVYSGAVKRLLLICEDRTKIIQSEEALKDTQMLEDQSIARILQIKKSDPNMLPLFVKEINELIKKLDPHIEEKASRELCNSLHGIKGNARVAGFDFLTNITHELETFVLDKNKPETDSKWDEISENIEGIKSEWGEIESLYNSLNKVDGGASKAANLDDDVSDLFERYSRILNAGKLGDDPLKAERMMLAIKSINFTNLEDIKEKLKVQVEKTAENLNKEVNLNFKIEDITIEEYAKTSLSESLLHIMNNCVGHGIESPDDREMLGKERAGNIDLEISEGKGGTLQITVTDDGAGISLSSIVKTAVKRKIIELDSVPDISKEELLNLVFEPGFSTAESVTEVSGRGVGMDVVAERMKELDGTIQLDTVEGKGTTFVLKMKSGKKADISRTVFPLKKFQEILVKNIIQTGKEKKAQLEFDSEGIDSLENGIIYGDISRIILSLTTYIGSFVKNNGVYKFKLDRNVNKIQCNIKTIKSGKDKELLAEFNRPLNFCNEYIRQHNGKVEKSDKELNVLFGNLLSKNDIPEINIAFEKGTTEDDAKGTKNKIEQVQNELDLPIKISMKPSIQTNLMVLSNPTNGGELNLTLGASKASIQKDLRRKIESVFRALDKF
ncbi:ATP-binding protein [Bacteriovoracales bacterium]|nr:ATP-binding protein [Bacteriovoracales bacterium]